MKQYPDVLTTGEMDINSYFEKFEKILPMPKQLKHGLLTLMSYVLCM